MKALEIIPIKGRVGRLVALDELVRVGDVVRSARGTWRVTAIESKLGPPELPEPLPLGAMLVGMDGTELFPEVGEVLEVSARAVPS